MDETLTLEEAKLLIEHCRAGRLYEVERWIASGKSIQPPLPSDLLPEISAIENQDSLVI